MLNSSVWTCSQIMAILRKQNQDADFFNDFSLIVPLINVSDVNMIKLWIFLKLVENRYKLYRPTFVSSVPVFSYMLRDRIVWEEGDGGELYQIIHAEGNLKIADQTKNTVSTKYLGSAIA